MQAKARDYRNPQTGFGSRTLKGVLIFSFVEESERRRSKRR